MPSWAHIAQLYDYYSFDDEKRPLAIAKADRAEACKQILLLKDDQLTTAQLFGCAANTAFRERTQLKDDPRTQLFGCAAAVESAGESAVVTEMQISQNTVSRFLR